MKNFRDFHITGREEDLVKFANEIRNYVSGNWSIKIDSKFKDNFIVFAYTGMDVEQAFIYLYTKDKNKFAITNIVPTRKNSLTYDEYNSLLLKCAEECILPCASKCNLNYKISDDEVDLETYMTVNSAKKLHVFSQSANKSTGSSHPLDQQRWHDFICQAFVEGSTNVASIIGRWLSEEGGWDDEHANELVIEYEQGIALLAFYKENYHG